MRLPAFSSLIAFDITSMRQAYDATQQVVEAAQNIVSFGAVGDGAADDSGAIQAAINEAALTGGVVFIPAGTYRIATGLTVTASTGVVLSGLGPASVIKSSVAGLGAQITITGNNVTLDGLTLDGSYVSGATAGDFGLVEIRNCRHAKVTSCTIKNSLNLGVAIRGSAEDAEVSRCILGNNFCSLHSFSTAGSPATAPHRIRIVGNQFVQNWGAGGESGAIKLQTTPAHAIDSWGHVVANNQIVDAGQMGIELWDRINYCSVIGNTIEGCDWGISLDRNKGTTVSGNTINRPTTYGLEFATVCDSCAITGNTVSGYNAAGTRTATYGLIGSNTANVRMTVSGNTVQGFTGFGIYVAGVTDSVVANNMVNDCGVTLNVVACSRIIFSANLLRNPVASHLVLDYTDGNGVTLAFHANTFVGTAGFDNVFFYDGAGTHTITGVSFTQNDFTAANFTNAAFDYNIPVARLPSLVIAGNLYIVGSGTQAPDNGSYPFAPSLQQYSIPVAAKFSFVAASNGGDQWFKVFSRDEGIPIALQFHVEANFIATDNKASSQTFFVAGSPYGQAANVGKFPDGQFNGSVTKGVIYNNPSSGSVHEIWVRIGPTAGGTITIAGADFATSWITAPSAVTSAPTFGANSYELNTAVDSGSLRNRIIAADVLTGSEQTTPAAPAADGYKIYAKDNGSGKTGLYVLFATGAEQQIKVQA